MDLKKISINDIGLSNRSKNALGRIGIETVHDMLECTRESLSEVRNLGVKSIDEILDKIEEYQNIADISVSENLDEWIKTDEGLEYVVSFIERKQIKIDSLELLSAKAYNLLKLNGYDYLHQVVILSEEELMAIPRMDQSSAKEIKRSVNHSTRDFFEEIKESLRVRYMSSNEQGYCGVADFINCSDYHETLLRYVKEHDLEIVSMAITNRAKRQLTLNGYVMLSDIILMKQEDYMQIPAMGINTVESIMEKIKDYLQEHETRILAIYNGDEEALWSDKEIQVMILRLYDEEPFRGFSLSEFTAHLQLPDIVTIERLKSNIGALLAAGKLEYVDFRCYRVYEKFASYLMRCEDISDRNRAFLYRKLQGDTLEVIGQDYQVTRERVRQVIKKDYIKLKKLYYAETGVKWFDEEYFKYIFYNYDFDKSVGEEWLGISSETWQYLYLLDEKRGKKDLHEALEDHSIEPALKLKIKNYLNRNKIYLDGAWIEKKRAAIEDYVLQKKCTHSVSYEEFVVIYNKFLEDNDIEYDENLYYNEDVLATRKNRLSEARTLLWKQNEQLRYYDIDSRDYTELLDTLNFDAYENVEFSTLKFVNEYPEVMERYDIHDQYELHNLLRKIIPEGSFNKFRCGRMPEIKFGDFDRTQAILEIMLANAPINTENLAELIKQEYGYEIDTIIGSYLPALSAYYHQGIYSVPQKKMSETNMERLKSVLTEDFYYIDEIKQAYMKAVADADTEEINPYNLKQMGFTVLSKYALQNYSSLETYFDDLLRKEDIQDIAAYRKRYAYVVTFSNKLTSMKRNLEIIEFEPNQIISSKRLEKSGVTIEMIQEFCEQVYDFVETNTYFSSHSLKNAGFQSELYDLGFSDWFYSNLLLSDDRFSYANMYGNIILYKGKETITIKSFEEQIIRNYGSIDVYDLMTELIEAYGCKVTDRLDVIYKVQGTEVYYDKYMDRLYANIELFYREFDAVEGI